MISFPEISLIERIYNDDLFIYEDYLLFELILIVIDEAVVVCLFLNRQVLDRLYA
jgi:hypothetical protein